MAPNASSLTSLLANEEDPSRRLDIIDEALGPPEPQLLDTSVLQNLDWVDRTIEGANGSARWDAESEAKLVARFGAEHAADLLDVGTLYKRFEYLGCYPWLVCNAAIEEADLFKGSKGERLRQFIDFLSGLQDDWANDAHPGIAQGLLLATRRSRVSPLILRALGVNTPEEVAAPTGPLAFLPDRGDRLLAAHAVLANIPAILTTDRRTFWAHRDALRSLGVEVFRPSELLALYDPYWIAVEAEMARRSARGRGARRRAHEER